jgi:hypothetical protein
MAVRCESGWVLCRNVAERQCTVCGRFFCASHGDVEAGHCRRCRSAYARRVEATAAAYSEATRQTQAANRNANGLCGWADCHQAPVVLCQHCGLLYCAYHTNHYHYRYRYRSRRGVEMHRAEIILCDACKSALPDYKREKTWLEV